MGMVRTFADHFFDKDKDKDKKAFITVTCFSVWSVNRTKAVQPWRLVLVHSCPSKLN